MSSFTSFIGLQIQEIENLKDEKSSLLDGFWVTFFVVLGLSFCWYFGRFSDFHRFFEHRFPRFTREDWYFYGYLWWALMVFIFYLVIPCLSLFLMNGRVHLGLSWKGFSDHWFYYFIMYLSFLGVLWVISSQASFQKQYPMFAYEYWRNTPHRYYIWLLVYSLQFFCVEFFFRGYILQILVQRMGVMSLFFMAVPYVMIHFQKPFLESMGAFLGGLWLGVWALRTGSIWGGVFLHILVALSMDLFSLGRQGLLGDIF